MSRFTPFSALLLALLVFFSFAPVLVAEDSPPPPEVSPEAPAPPSSAKPAAGSQPATQPAAASSADQVQNEMLDLLTPNPLFTPSYQSSPAQQPAASPPTANTVELDPNVLGLPPGAQQPHLRREGEFIVNRRGRLIHSPTGGHVLFLFEADSAQSPEPPMPLVPCQILENMENLVRDRSDQVVFILSGQVLLYRGTNFLLPTMMKIAIDWGNLNH